MSITTITSPITMREDVTDRYEVCNCKIHGKKPKITDVYTRKRPKFMGTAIECPISHECSVFGYDAKDVVEKWNKINQP